ncbi:ImmA/IrrE family metallo-endopeptidase [Leifsonia shinshuensis]|uniref:ImmA/IrrE family metallo-endopeptidase n=1 Tax=Leifsonia shinshuensis TaxID=150026 RepID=A0A7G6YA67_9MICO|nr:ImmA/IrrE family metallo-endopeptidase [Leifsonia shinshuensis]QNE35382.1 ImmA/IrrE family metallo-endopeptidase [Leifsonia shinshuensis]
MIRGFKTRAKALALEVREELNLDLMDPFDPYELAKLYGIEVVATSVLLPATAPKDAISGALVPTGTGTIIIDNDSEPPGRRKLTTSHEMSHVVLEHEFPAAIVDEQGCRTTIGDQEDEATFLAGELVLPYNAALKLAWRNTPDAVVARDYGISVHAAAWRMNASGARMLVNRSRKRRR